MLFLGCSVFSSVTLFLEGSKLSFSSPKNSSNESRSKKQYDRFDETRLKKFDELDFFSILNKIFTG